jgi:hypothetical protein
MADHGVPVSIAAESPYEISTRAARRRVMCNSQIQRLQSFHRPRAQAVEACAVFRRVVQASAPAYLRPLRGRSHDVMSAMAHFGSGT